MYVSIHPLLQYWHHVERIVHQFLRCCCKQQWQEVLDYTEPLLLVWHYVEGAV